MVHQVQPITLELALVAIVYDKSGMQNEVKVSYVQAVTKIVQSGFLG